MPAGRVRRGRGSPGKRPDAVHGDRAFVSSASTRRTTNVGARPAGGEIDPADRAPDRLAEGGDDLVRGVASLFLLERLEAVEREDDERRRAPGPLGAHELVGGAAEEERRA